jgi:hypothetical protein
MKDLRLISDAYRQRSVVRLTLRHFQVLLEYSSSKTTENYTLVSTQERGTIINPLDTFHNIQSGTIATATDVAAFAEINSQVLATTDHNKALKLNLVRFYRLLNSQVNLPIQNPEPHSV